MRLTTGAGAIQATGGVLPCWVSVGLQCPRQVGGIAGECGVGGGDRVGDLFEVFEVDGLHRFTDPVGACLGGEGETDAVRACINHSTGSGKRQALAMPLTGREASDAPANLAEKLLPIHPQITRVLKINQLETITDDVIEAAASTLVIGN